MVNSKEIWIREGYNVFALEGVNSIKISRLANKLNRNKSAFYHFFATSEIYIEELLDVHLMNILIMAKKIEQDQTLDNLITTLLHHKIDLLFNRELRVYRIEKEFEACFIKTNEIVGQSILPLWSKIIDLEEKSYLAKAILKLSLENFMLQITPEMFNHNWLKAYFTNIQLMIKELKRTRHQ